MFLAKNVSLCACLIAFYHLLVLLFCFEIFSCTSIPTRIWNAIGLEPIKKIFLCVRFSSLNLNQAFRFCFLPRTCNLCIFLLWESHVIAFRILKETWDRLLFWSYAFDFPVHWCSSLCLYNITSFFFFQDGILSKLTNLYLCNIQICVYCGHFSLTFRSRYDRITMLGGL